MFSPPLGEALRPFRAGPGPLGVKLLALLALGVVPATVAQMAVEVEGGLTVFGPLYPTVRGQPILMVGWAAAVWAMAWGLWARREWARLMALALNVGGLALGAWALATGPWPLVAAFGGARVVLDATIVAYLLRPATRRAFSWGPNRRQPKERGAPDG